jgi:N-acetyl-anhydromuramyl-L-alanine amidase AmpD
MRRLPLALVAAALGCATPTTTPPEGPVAQSIARAAADANVPRDLVVAVAAVEGGLNLSPVRVPDPADHVPVAGALELRHGRFDSLARGAQLTGVAELALRSDTEAATRAGALVLAELGRDTHARNEDLSSWRSALVTLSGLDDSSAARYADDVLATLAAGGDFAAYGGERVHLAAHSELSSAAAVSIRAHADAAATPEFPGAIWFQTSCTGKCDTTRTAGDAVVDTIVIHDTEGGWTASVATLQNDAGKSVHYIVDADGSRVGQFVPESYTAWHAGNYYYNQRSVGIEHVGTASNPNGYSDALYAKSEALVKSIRTRWKVPLDRTHIIGHYQIPDGNVEAESSAPCADKLDACETSGTFGGADNHRDPGENWMWCTYMKALGGSCDCNDAWPLWNCTTDRKQAVRCTNGNVEIESCTAGCVTKPVGQDDACRMTTPSGSGNGNDGGGSSGSDGGVSSGDGSGANGGGTSGGASGGASGGGANGNGGASGGGQGGNGDHAGGMHGGCDVGGHGDARFALGIILMICGAATRRLRRRAARLF